MKELISSKSHMIGKLFIFQVASSLLGLFVSSPFSNGNNPLTPTLQLVQIAAGLFSTLFYFSLICYAIIEDGQKDCVANTAGRLEKGSALTGFKYALVSYIPTAAFVIIQMLLMLLSKPEQLGFLKLILAVIIRFFFMGTYLGFSMVLTSSPQSTAVSAFICDNYIFHTVLLVLMPLICGLAYYLAFNGKVHVDTSEKKKKK